MRELDDAEAVNDGEVGIEAPPKVCEELLRPVDFRDRDDERFELYVFPIES
jgi:hypothetical protein